MLLCAQALSQPESFCSTISDGMAQNHCHLPWFGNLTTKAHIKQHLQGKLMIMLY